MQRKLESASGNIRSILIIDVGHILLGFEVVEGGLDTPEAVRDIALCDVEALGRVCLLIYFPEQPGQIIVVDQCGVGHVSHALRTRAVERACERN